jgi:hypothetical protein
VSQEPLDLVEIHALLDQPGRKGVTQVVKPEVRKTDPLSGFRESPQHISSLQLSALACGEDQATLPLAGRLFGREQLKHGAIEALSKIASTNSQPSSPP